MHLDLPLVWCHSMTSPHFGGGCKCERREMQPPGQLCQQKRVPKQKWRPSSQVSSQVAKQCRLPYVFHKKRHPKTLHNSRHLFDTCGYRIHFYVETEPAFYFLHSFINFCTYVHTRIMISKGMVSKGQYSKFGPVKGFQYSF